MILDKDLKGDTVANYIKEMYEKGSIRIDMQRASRGLGRPDACSKIVNIAESMVRQK